MSPKGWNFWYMNLSIGNQKPFESKKNIQIFTHHSVAVLCGVEWRREWSGVKHVCLSVDCLNSTNPSFMKKPLKSHQLKICKLPGWNQCNIYRYTYLPVSLKNSKDQGIHLNEKIKYWLNFLKGVKFILSCKYMNNITIIALFYGFEE